MGFFKVLTDGFRGMPDFSSLRTKTYQIEDRLLTISVPHNNTTGVDYYNYIKLCDFNDLSKVSEHEKLLTLGYASFSFQKKVIVPILPTNSAGSVYVVINLKKANVSVDTISILSDFLEKNYYEYYHDPIVSDDSTRGMHTDLMNEAHDFAVRCWGENPESQEDVKEKQEFLLDSFLRAYPPIKCEEVDIGDHVFLKYKEGNINLLNKCSRLYNLPLKDDYYISIDFHYEIEQSMASRKFVDWVRTADEHFERSILETVELSRVVDSIVDIPADKIESRDS